MIKVDFEKWMAANEPPYFTTEVGSQGNGCCRDCYKLPNGVHIYDHWVSPYNFLKPSYSYVVIDFNVAHTPENVKKVEEYGGTAQDWGYVPDGFFLPVFQQAIKNPSSVFNKKVEDDQEAYMKRAFRYINEVLTTFPEV